MKNLSRIILAMLVVFSGSFAAAQDLDAIVENCNSCHGTNGVSQWADMPTIAGLDAFTHADALFVYRDEERACAESKHRMGDTSKAPTTMCAVTADMSDDDIEAVADHFAALPFAAAAQDFDATLAETGAAIHKSECDRCHSEGGSNADDEAGILAGQWMGYLRTAFAQYAAGERPQDKKMKEKMDPLSSDDIEALLHYYASQQ
jgi:sulfide dehydrogenase cytochrome subunit